MRKTLILILTLFAVFTTVDARSKKDQDRALIDKVAMWQIDHQLPRSRSLDALHG